MNDRISFETSQTAQEHKRISIWLILSLLLTSIVATYIIYYSIKNMKAVNLLKFELFNLQKKVSELETGLPISNNQQVEKNKFEKIKRIKKKYDNPGYYLRIIENIIPDDVRLTLIHRLPKRYIELTGVAKNMHSVNLFVQGLKKITCFQSCAIHSLQPEEINPEKKYVNFIIKGQIKK